MSVYDLKDHQDLIDAVNDVITSPPDPCVGTDSLTKPDKTVVFRVSADDYATWQDIRDKMDSYASANSGSTPCGPLTWTHPDTLNNKTIWKQETIDEINTNLTILQECQCQCTVIPCDSENGTVIVVNSNNMEVFCDSGGGSPPEDADVLTDICPLINGTTVAAAGCQGRTYGLTRTTDAWVDPETTLTQPATSLGLGGGTINCDGTAVCTGSITAHFRGGVAISGDCSSVLAEYEAALGGKKVKILLTIFAGEHSTQTDSDCDGQHDCQEGGEGS